MAFRQRKNPSFKGKKFPLADSIATFKIFDIIRFYLTETTGEITCLPKSAG